MRIAILSDIHSNLPAIRSVFSSIEAMKVDEIYCLGDIVGYGPFPNECIEMVRKHCTFVTAGNHDYGLVGKTNLDLFNKPGKKVLLWTRKIITDQNFEYLQNLQLMCTRNDLTFVHSSPSIPDAWTYVFSIAQAKAAFLDLHTSICFFGHTHFPIIIGEDSTVNQFKKGTRSLINVGSVGQPRDGNTMAAYGIFDSAEYSYSMIRVGYDVQKTVNAMSEAGLPRVLIHRLLNGV